MRINLKKEADQALENLKDQKMKDRLRTAINELKERGLLASNLKRLSHPKQGYRKRVGRYRILFTINDKEQAIHIWVIEIKKSPKDYKRWIENMEKNR